MIGQATLSEFRNYIELALRAGFFGGYTGTDPLVLDLDGDGVELTRREAGDVYFDLAGDGFARRTADVLFDNDATDTRYLGDTSVSEAAGAWKMAA